MRIESEGKAGAVREVKAGSGYWSQESAVQVVAAKEESRIWVRWPGGKETRSPIPNGAKEIEVNTNGVLRVIR